MAKHINLLPWRDELRAERQKEFLTLTALVFLAGALVFAMVFYGYSMAIDYQNSRNQYLERNIEELDKQVQEIKDIKDRKARLIERMEIIQGLQGNRPVIVHLFDELVRVLPDGVHFKSLDRKANKISIKGTAETSNRVSELMRNFDASVWFKNPNLSAVVANESFGEQANDFTLSVDIVDPSKKDDEAE